MKIIKSPDVAVTVDNMKDGDIAVIAVWPTSSYIGRIVQRFGNHLIALGMGSDNGWDAFFDKYDNYSDCEVKILSPGTQIEL